MRFQDLVDIVGEEPVFETGLLLAGEVDPADVRRQLCRWVRTGKVVKLRRGVYALEPPYRKVKPHPFVVANRLALGSYVSRQSALEYYGMIPEHTPVVTSITPRRPGLVSTPLGRYDYRRVKAEMRFGYTLTEVDYDQKAFVARPEKALLDLVYLHPGGDSAAHLSGLRLQNLERLDLAALEQMAEKVKSPKLRRAATAIARLAREWREEWETR